VTRASVDRSGVSGLPARYGRSEWRASARLPSFPWDQLAPLGDVARSHPDGIVDLSVGTPTDPTPAVVQRTLAAAANAPGYPFAVGSARLREAAAGWLRRRLGVHDVPPAGVLPLSGSKELVAALPTLLGLGPRDRVAYPVLAYPTYDVGARLAGAEPVAVDGVVGLGAAPVGLVWVNSPANPTGRILSAEHLREVVGWAREHGAVVASDECYVELGWTATPVSILHPSVCGGSHEGILALHSLSKRSTMAGYRAGFVAGDRALIRELIELRKHSGHLVPLPVQAAMAAALDDDQHVEEQKQRYAARRTALRGALIGAGFRIDHSEGGLYLWATRDEPCWETTRQLAERGILVAPGEFYGPAGARHVRVGLTATDERVAAAVERLAAEPALS
jgi:succinyldiaminopimelate transaminase